MVVAEHDQVTRSGRDARTVGDRAAGLLRPRPDVADVAEALSGAAYRLARLLGDPGREVCAPGLAGGGAGGRGAVHRDRGTVV